MIEEIEGTIIKFADYIEQGGGTSPLKAKSEFKIFFTVLIIGL